MPDRQKFLAATAPLTFVVLWSSAFIAGRAGLLYASPLFFLALRFALATAGLALILMAFRSGLPWRRRALLHLAAVGVMINGLYLSGGFIALTSIGAATMALIGAFHPLVTALLAVPLLGEKMRRRQWFGLGLGLLGVVLVVGPGSAAWSNLQGVAFGAGGVAFLALGTIYHRRHCRDLPLVPSNAVQQAAGALFCFAAAFFWEDIRFVPTPQSVGILFYLAFVVSIGAMALFFFMLRSGTAGQVASNFYLTPGMTAIMGWLLLGESLDLTALFGFAIASAGVWLAHRKNAPDVL